MPNKIQVQKIHIFGRMLHSNNLDKIGKSRLRFCTGSGAKGAMSIDDYSVILTNTVAVDMPTGRRGKVLLEDNHYRHGHAPKSPLHQVKKVLNIRFHANINIPASADLNVIEKIFGTMKQRVKARGHPKKILMS